MKNIYHHLSRVLLTILSALFLTSCAAPLASGQNSLRPTAVAPIATQLAAIMQSTSQPTQTEATLTSQPTQMGPTPTTQIFIPTITQDVTATTVYTYTIINTYPHDPNAFTQGLIYQDGVLYEGTGLNGRSSLRRVDLTTGEVLQQRDLAPEYFGEGITLFGNRIVQLTWQSFVGFVYDKDTFEPIQEWEYPTEGWGITHDETRLIMSDGTSTIYFRDPQTLAETGRLEVHDNNGPVARLNELEYINGEIYANIWQTDRIARINPQTGQVTGWIDLQGLLTPEDLLQPVDVLNGIAYDQQNDRLFVTGKLWPKLFEIKLQLKQ